MGYDLLKDAERGMVALVDSELGRALGPVLEGPGAEAALEAFVDALGVDPAKLEHWEIQQRFSAFLEAIQQGEAQSAESSAPAEPSEPVVVVTEPIPPDPSAGSDHAGEPSSETEPPADVPAAAEGAPTDEPPAEAPADTDPTETSSPEASESDTSSGDQTNATSDLSSGPEATRPTVPEGRATCPECEGWGTVAQNGAVVQCPVCKGEGSVSPEVADAIAGEHGAAG